MAFNEDNNKVVKATSTNTSLLSDVRLIVEQGLKTAYQGVNSVMVKTYWQVGRRIVEEEQQGEKRAEYGKQIITLLAEDLSKSYNRGFTARSSVVSSVLFEFQRLRDLALASTKS